MKIETGIIADDFTGAGDSSIYFCHAGYSVFLPLSLKKEDIPLQPGVLAINSESRLISNEEAYIKVCRTVQKCLDLGVESFYKKIDSTLRGNIEAEVNALMDTAGYKAVIICPAAPDVGRTVLNGECLIYDKPINQTESGKDHLNPVKSAYIKDHFPTIKPSCIHHFTIQDLESERGSFIAKVNVLLEEGVTHMICDAGTKEHLTEIASLFGDKRILLVGAGGLAKAISATYGHSQKSESSNLFPNGQVLVISGSKMEVSRKQIRKLSRLRDHSVVEIPVGKILDNNKKALDQFLADLSLLDQCKPVILIPGNNDKEESPEDIKANSEVIADFMGETTNRLCKDRSISVLVIIGGHTTYKTMKKLNALGVLYKGEVIPGTPYGRLVNKEQTDSPSLVTKSGSFGDEDALVDIVDFINEKMLEKE